MNHKLVTRDAVKSIYQTNQELRMDELIKELNDRGYSASERALVDIGVYPTYVQVEGKRKIYARMK